MARLQAAKPEVMKRQMDLLNARYDPSDRPAQGVTMSRGKSMQEGARVKLPTGFTWDKLMIVSPEERREKNLFPAGFFPLPPPGPPGKRYDLLQVRHLSLTMSDYLTRSWVAVTAWYRAGACGLWC